MSRYSPQVLPEYQGGNVGGRIAQAFMMRDQLNRQKDLDAVQTGVGLHPISDYEAQNPEPAQSGFMHTVRGALAKVRGEANPDDTAHVGYVRGMLNNMAGQNASVNSAAAAQTAQTGQPVMPEQPNGTADGFSMAQPKTPGAFNPMTGGFGPAVSRYAKLPSGQTIDMAYTPFGQRLQQAMMSHEYNMALAGVKGDQKIQQLGVQGNNQANVANIRGGFQVQTTGMRNDQSNTNNIRTTHQSAINHSTPSGSTIYSASHRAPSAGADPSAYVTKRMAALVKPQRDPLTGLEKPGLSPEDAAAQAQQEWQAAHGGAGTPPPPSRRRLRPSGATGGTGNITLGAPQDQGSPMQAAMQEHEQQAAKYQQALKLGVDPKAALEAYATDVAATKKKYRIKD